MSREVLFKFADPGPDGVDVPIVGVAVTCSLLVAEPSADGIRSARSFDVVTDETGQAVATLSVTSADQAWHIEVAGVPGMAERWVSVPAGEGRIRFDELVSVDPASVPVGPGLVKTWQQLWEAIEALEGVDPEVIAQEVNRYLDENPVSGGVEAVPHPTFPGVIVLRVAAPAGFPAVTAFGPVSTSVEVGDPVALTVTATGDPAPSYRWQESDDGLEWWDVPGASSATLDASPTAAGTVLYRCVVSNVHGSVTSGVMTVVAVPGATAPTITSPTGSIDIALDGAPQASFTAAADSSSALAVRWQSSPNGSTGWADIAGATSATIVVTEAMILAAPGGFGLITRAVFTNDVGSTPTPVVNFMLYTP